MTDPDLEFTPLLGQARPVDPERYAKALEVVEALKNAGLDRTHSRYRGPNENPPVCNRCGLSWPCPKAALVTALAAFDGVPDDPGTASPQRVQEPVLDELLAGRLVIIYAPDATDAAWWRSRGYTVWP